MNQKWNNDKCWCESKKCHAREKDYIWNPATCNYQNGKYLVYIKDDSMIASDEVIKNIQRRKNCYSNKF